MKRIELKDLLALKEAKYCLFLDVDVFRPVEVYPALSCSDRICFVFPGLEESQYTNDSVFYEMDIPVVGQTELFSKTYCGESLADLERDISEAFVGNPAMDAVPVDEYNFHSGSFKVTMTWTPDNDNS